MLDFDDLEQLTALRGAELSAAAEELHISQPTITRTIGGWKTISALRCLSPDKNSMN
ncbi:MAG: hypothetical protein ACLU2K_05575 [Clostridia bacterium]